MFLSHFKFRTRGWLLTLVAGALLGVTTPSCGGDDDDDGPDAPDKTERPSESEQPSDPGQPSEPEEPIEPEKPLPVIEEDEFLGHWQVTELKTVYRQVQNGKWVTLRADVASVANGDRITQWWSNIWLLRTYGFNRVLYNLWDSDIEKMYDLLDKRGEGGVGSGAGRVYVSGHTITGDYFSWSWSGGQFTNMLVLTKDRQVRFRWKVTGFDGDSFDTSMVSEASASSMNEGDDTYDYYMRYERVATDLPLEIDN